VRLRIFCDTIGSPRHAKAAGAFLASPGESHLRLRQARDDQVLDPAPWQGHPCSTPEIEKAYDAGWAVAEAKAAWGIAVS
jgi:hypothetical protein